jgi:hypothetical protein
MTPKDYYTQGIKKKLAFYFPAWLPNTRFELGDIGEMDGVAFRRVRNLKDVGIAFDVRPDPNPSALDIISGEGASITFKAAGQVSAAMPSIPAASAGVSVEFGREGAFLIQAEDVHEPSISDIVKLQNDILEAYKNGTWQLGWKVVVKLTSSANAVILVSQSANAKVEISASGDVPAGSFKLTDASVKLAFTHTSGDIVRVDRGQEVTPLIQLAGIHWKQGWPFQREARVEKFIADPAAPVPAPTPEQARADPHAAGALYLDLIR